MSNPRRRMRTLVAAIAICGAASCGGSSSTSPTLPDISGAWLLDATLLNANFITCQMTGDLSISQSGDRFTGQVSGSRVECFSPRDSTNAGNVDGPLTDGSISRTSLMRFSGRRCSYIDGGIDNGIIVTAPAKMVGGSVSCDIVYKGDVSTFNGRWTLNR